MNIRQIKKVNFKIIGLSVAVVMLAVFALWSHFKSASGAQGDPEAQMQDLVGGDRNSFSIDESGYLNARAYSERIPDFTEPLDIVLAIDVSGSMKDIIPGTTPAITKLTRAKNFAEGFVEQVGISDSVHISVVRIDSNVLPADITALTPIDSNIAKTNMINHINSLAEEGGGTDISGAITRANNVLIGGRANATKYVVLLTDMGENGPYDGSGNQTFLNRYEFTSADPTYVKDWSRNWIGDMNAEVTPGSILASSIANNIKMVGIYVNPHGAVNDLSIPPNRVAPGAVEGGYSGIQYGNAGLMRFAVAKTNGITMSGSTSSWNTDFTSEPNLDNKYFYLFYDDIINQIYQFIRGNTGVDLGYFLKVAPQAELETVYSAIDKGGRVRGIQLEELSDGYYKIKTDFVPGSYMCFSNDVFCQSRAVLHDDGTYWIEDNYLDIKIKVKFTGLGVFDLLSNYTGCETGPLQRVAQDSRVEYYDPRDNTKYKTMYFKSVCVRVAESSPSVIKTSYATDPGDDLASPKGTRQASFDAGDDVWIVLEIDDSTSGRTDFMIGDEVPASVSGAVEYSFYHGASKVKSGEVVISSSKAFFKGQDSGGVGETIGGLANGKNFIKYKFKI